MKKGRVVSEIEAKDFRARLLTAAKSSKNPLLREAAKAFDVLLDALIASRRDREGLNNQLDAKSNDVRLHFDRANRAEAKLTNPDPIPMLLFCPACGDRHVDEGEFALKTHHTHACQNCGMTWRPAVVATVGVRFLPGFKDGEKG